MRIIFFVPYPKEGPSNRYRVEQYLPYLKERGIRYHVSAFWSTRAYKLLYTKGNRTIKVLFFISSTMRRFASVIRALGYDIVFVHRESYPVGGAFIESVLAFLGKRLIFDFDDAIFLPSTSKMNKFMDRLKDPNKLPRIIKLSRHVIAGNRYLLGFAQEYNSRVSVIPTPVDTDRYNSRGAGAAEGKKGLVVGWMGSPTTVDFLYDIKEVFAGLSSRRPSVVFKIVGGRFAIEGVPGIVNKAWSLDDELADLASFDIGIMPMPENPWTKGKCGFKVLLYMSMGIPVVCSPVGVNKEIVRDGVNGFFARGRDEWIEKVSILAGDPGLRKSVGLEGRKTVEEKYSVRANWPLLLNVLERVHENGD